jgi:hypothetical protein
MRQIVGIIIFCIVLSGCSQTNSPVQADPIIKTNDCNILEGIEQSKCELNKNYINNPNGGSIIRLQSEVSGYYNENPSLSSIINEITNTNFAPNYRIYLSKIMRNQGKVKIWSANEVLEHEEKLFNVINNKKDEPSVRGAVLDSLSHLYYSIRVNGENIDEENLFKSAEAMIKEDKTSEYAVASLWGVMAGINQNRTKNIVCNNLDKLSEDMKKTIEPQC